MSIRPKKILLWVLYVVFYVVSLVVFALLTFPFDTLRDRAVVAFADDQRKTGGDSRLEIDKLSSYWILGVEAEGVRMISPPPANGKGGKAAKGDTTDVEFDRVTARVALLPLLIGRVSISFSAEMLGGKIKGTTRKSGEDRLISLDVSDLEVGRLRALVDVIGLPLSGTLGGTVSLTLPDDKIGKSGGSIHLVLESLAVGDGKAEFRDSIVLPRVDIGDLELECEIEEGKLSITKFGAEGGDLDFFAEGKITLRDKMATSMADLMLRFKFSDKYKNKNEKTQLLFGSSDSKAPPLLEMDPKVKQSKRPDGFYGWRASGLLASMRFDPAPSDGPAQKPPRGGARGGAR